MKITINVSDQLAEEARARGVSVEVYVEQMLAGKAPDATNGARAESVGQAIDRIRELRKGNKLAGLRLRGLLHEGHKY